MNIKDKLKTFGLAYLLGLSPLSSSAQDTTDDASSAPLIENTHSVSKETLYSYIPSSLEHYHETCQKGLLALTNETIPEELKTMYQGFIKFYEENKENKLSLNDPMVRKSFLAFKKLAKYEALNNFDHITPSIAAQKHFEQEGDLPHYTEYKKGYYNEFSKLLGADAQSFHQTTNKFDPKFVAFCSVLYETNDRFKMLSKEDSNLAEPIATRLLSKKLQSYNITPKDTTFQYMTDFQSVVYTYDDDTRANNWEKQVVIDPTHLNGDNGLYCPLSIIKAHELGHIMQSMPGTKENSFAENSLAELAPTIELIVMQDMVYKEIHNIPLEKEVTYPSSPDTPLPNLGKIANTFRSIKEQHNFKSYEDVLLTKEATLAINRFTQNIDEQEILSNIKKDKELNELIEAMAKEEINSIDTQPEPQKKSPQTTQEVSPTKNTILDLRHHHNER